MKIPAAFRVPKARPRGKAIQRPEQGFQIAVVNFIRAAAPDLLFFHVPNGAGRSAVEGEILRLMGVLAGVADLVIVLPDGSVGFIELKAGKGRLSPAQQTFKDRALKANARWAEARTLDDIAAVLSAWLAPFGLKLRGALQ